MDLRIKDKVYLVTGGGSGIGGAARCKRVSGPKCGRSSRSCISSKSN